MGKSLLLADDSVTIQKVVGLSFASEDIDITTVDNGDDAVTRARELRPDVILADVVMPGMSGYEVCHAIKSDPELQHIPVLLLTGTFEAFDDARAAEVGAAGHVAKPFEAQTLVERVKELLTAAPVAAPPPVAEPEPAPTPAVESAAPVVDTPPPPPPMPEVATPAPDATLSLDAEPPPAPAAPASFDFFDEPAAPATDVTPDEGAFSFDSGDLASAQSEAPPPAAHTVAILPDELEAPSPQTPVETPAVPPAPPTPAPSESFDFEFESVRAQTPDPVEPAAATQIADASLLDAAGSSEFDVSSSDLGDLQFSTPDGEAPPPPPAAPTMLLDPADLPPAPQSSPAAEPTPVTGLDADPVMELLSSPQLPEDAADLVDADPEPADPFDLPAAEAVAEPEPIPAPAPPIDDVPLAEPVSMPEPVTSVDVVMDAVDAPEAEPEPAWPAEPVDAEPVADAQMISEASDLPDADALVREMTPVLREQLHETLEKIAWESFGQVTETIVEHAVERLEKAAWEVVPKLAETLILEEIRKLKGE